MSETGESLLQIVKKGIAYSLKCAWVHTFRYSISYFKATTELSYCQNVR